MVVDVKILKPEQSVKEAADLFNQVNFESLPVVNDDKHLQGMLHISQLIPLMRKHSS